MDSDLEALIRLHLARDSGEKAEIAATDATTARMDAVAWAVEHSLTYVRIGKALGISAERGRQINAQHRRVSQ